jgi:hypothetical protein
VFDPAIRTAQGSPGTATESLTVEPTIVSSPTVPFSVTASAP